ncbi:MAG: formate/nitrite transporter family protein [Candidatus Eisenbacteria bacterium]|uniref:Formate/nitrite transporter family protein n=1 Tax=Eiseniibacteriota bacterium TaxID=2212470 RepID=A0A933SJR4_UNCEI|nr:formate/nitrite transporter family protein [Candidatus Eisenbacteria bacterium]
MARRAEEVGVAKAARSKRTLFALAVLAGAFIALGGVFASVAASGAGDAPWGFVRVLSGATFSLGLVLVVIGGAELFTGNVLLVMAWASRRVSTRSLLRNWLVAYAGNFVGACATAALVCLAATHELGGGAFGAYTLKTASAKLSLTFSQALVRGVLCNALVCLAVWLTYSARTTGDKIAAIVMPVAAFVAAGFEHSVANMYFVPLALFVKAWDPAFVAGAGLQGEAASLSWDAFLWRNLLPVTIGNILGGAVLVGATYWFVYMGAHRDRGGHRP